MVTTQTKELIWEGLIDAERDERYSDALVRRYRRYHRGIRVFLGVSTTGSVVYALGLLPISTYVAAAAVIGAVAAFEAVMEFSRKAAILGFVATDYAELGAAWHRLWIDATRPDSEDAPILGRLAELEARQEKLSLREVTADVSTTEKLNLKTSKEAYEALKNRYGTQSRPEAGGLGEGGSPKALKGTSSGDAEAGLVPST